MAGPKRERDVALRTSRTRGRSWKPEHALGWIALAALVLAWPGAAAAQDRFFPDLRGEWGEKLDLQPLPEYRLTPAQGAGYARKLQALAGIIRQADVFQPPRGIQPRLKAYFSHRQEGDTGRAALEVVQGREEIVVFWFYPSNGKPVWGGESNVKVQHWINDPYMAMGRDHDVFYEGLPLPDGRRIRFKPIRTGEVGGFPVYDDKRVIVTRSSRPLWLPVSREQYLAALIQHRRQAVTEAERGTAVTPYRNWLNERPERFKRRDEIYAALKRQDAAKAEAFLKQSAEIEARTEAELKRTEPQGEPPTVRAARDVVAGLEAELARLTPAQRSSQAWIRSASDLDSGLMPAGSPGARPLVVTNWAFLDRTSRTDWQVIVVTFELGTTESRPQHLGPVRLREYRNTLDWRRVAELLD